MVVSMDVFPPTAVLPSMVKWTQIPSTVLDLSIHFPNCGMGNRAIIPELIVGKK